MIEAQIICSEPVEIPDLSLNLSRGEEVWVSDNQARNSKDLKRAVAIGAVRVYHRERNPKQPRRHAPPNFQRLRPTPRMMTEPSPLEPTTMDTEALAAKIKAEMMGELQSTIAQEIAKALAAHSASPRPSEAAPSLGAAEMAAVMEGVLKRHMATPNGSSSGNPRPQPHPQGGRVEEMPLYIPEGIVDKDAKTAISVQSKTDSSEELDEATKLLRDMKKKRQTDGDS